MTVKQFLGEILLLKKDHDYFELSTVGLKKKAVTGAGVNIITNFIGFLFQTLGVIILTRLLTPKDFGQVAMVTAFSLWPMNFGANGFTEYIIQQKQIFNYELNSIFWLHLFISSFLAIGFTLFGYFLVYFYSEPKLLGIAGAMSTSFIFVAMYTTHKAILVREMKFGSIAIVSLSAIILSIVASILAAIAGMMHWAVVIRQLTSPFVTVIGTWAVCHWRPQVPKKIANAVYGLKYAIKVYSNFSIGYVSRNIDKVLIGKFHGSAVLGNYDRSYYLSMIPIGQLLTPLHSVAQSTLSRLQDDKERYTNYYIKAVSMISLLGTAAALILTLSAKDIIYLLLGPEWKDAGPVVMAFGPGVSAMLIYGTHSWLHLSLGTPGRWMRWNLFASIFTIAAFAVAATYGSVAMAFAYSMTAYVLTFPALWYGGRPIELRITRIITSLWSNFVSAVLVFFTWLIISKYWLPLNLCSGNLNLFLNILIVSTGALIFYLSIVIVFQKNIRSITEIISIVRLFLSK